MALSQNAFAYGLDRAWRQNRSQVGYGDAPQIGWQRVARNGSENAARAAAFSPSSERAMNSKYPGTCKACGRRFEVGTPIFWSKAAGSKHQECPPVSLRDMNQDDAEMARMEMAADRAQSIREAKASQDADDPQLAVDLAFAARDAEQRAANLKNLQIGVYRVEFSGRRDTDALNLKITKDRNNDGAFYFKQRESYEGTGRIWADGRIQLWKDNGLTAEQQARAVKALDILLGSERMGKYAEAYARESGECWRCGRELTLEDSIDRGLGSTCAMKVEAGY